MVQVSGRVTDVTSRFLFKAKSLSPCSPSSIVLNCDSEASHPWSPAQPQYCHLCTHPCKSPEDCPPQKLPSRENVCQLWSGEVGPGPSTSAASLPTPNR